MAHTTLSELNERLKSYVCRENHAVFSVYEGGTPTGIFAFLILSNEQYVELLEAMTTSEFACREILWNVRAEYNGFTFDCVFNPDNTAVSGALQELGAQFYPVQISLRIKQAEVYESDHLILPLEEKHHAEYISIHAKDCYWTAERVIAAPQIMHAFVSFCDDKVVGYIDFTVNSDESEIYDVFVVEEYRGRGIGKALVSAAIKNVSPKSVFVVIDENDEYALRMYQQLGFEAVENGRQVTASMTL